MRLALAAAWLLIAQDGSGYAWEQHCTVTPDAMRCEWSNGPGVAWRTGP